ncbi:DUF533 domain-containing protein [Tianweitania sediminis]|uniref:DUF533 domain-containing protein n=1 Tax=Tianweitania sediminis TaxID=1502156 RepID=A0A8J7R508_9HYPH|nr:DUF533 domain-containing protein [Tianweitania sediminis]MBP0437682.1 DUF533 domain-containing protein [Tianweitania sediminis]
MSMKHLLGMMLASRMAGRGTRRGYGGFGGGMGGLGGLAAGSLLGGRGGFGRKAGLAALGYMAYRAYQDHQSRSAASGAATGAANPTAGGASGSGIGGALGGLFKSVGDALGGGQQAQGASAANAPAASTTAAETFSAEDEQAADAFSEETALLLLRAMIAAAHADGTISAEERYRIMGHAEDADDRRVLERELASPRALPELLAQVKDRETAEEFYLASSAAVDGGSDANRLYLSRLREQLGLDEKVAAEIDSLAS